MTKDKKTKTAPTRQFTLTRAEIEKLYKISEHFGEVNLFTVIQTNESGIGPTTKVKFDLFDKQDTKVDITDVTSW
jgi:hypothetical protein